ncbi:hypothetical protein [Pedobacter cryoconitis]|uniref:hypothetical protein n=1 Tax=Pedobacter cryoconitis TaxID=188932 RepID=UPI0016168102|nr:hypothetical protein [Pedobacter cryoconitis]MBB5645771.1 hypothetical protein [Pedobacter cryoconitis]
MELKNNLWKISVSVALIMLITVQLSQGQTFGEFFNQKKTQKRYLLEQIAALQVYIGYAKKGYDIASSGLQTVRDITSGEFNLHSGFINSLKLVSPAVRKNYKVIEIIDYQIRISKAFASVKYNDLLSLPNQSYVGDVQSQVILDCGNDLEELLLIITSGKIKMRDEERLKRLDKLYDSMIDKYAFTMDFIGQVNTLLRQSEQQQLWINQLRRNYEIN